MYNELIPESHEPEEIIWLDEPDEDYDYGINTDEMDEIDTTGECYESNY